jgi:predicted RNA-binding Zn-ribbon protein involved in translation (DUF1610 family)
VIEAQWKTCTVICPKCVGAAVMTRLVESDNCSFEDAYRCNDCGFTWLDGEGDEIVALEP